MNIQQKEKTIKANSETVSTKKMGFPPVLNNKQKQHNKNKQGKRRWATVLLDNAIWQPQPLESETFSGIKLPAFVRDPDGTVRYDARADASIHNA